MKVVFKRRDDAEIATAAAQAPEEIGVFGRTCPHPSTVGRHDIGGQEIIACQSESAAQPAKATTERKSGDAGVTVDTHGRGEAMGLRRPVEFTQEQPGFGARNVALGINSNLLHPRQVNYQAAVTHGIPSDVMAAAADRETQLL